MATMRLALNLRSDLRRLSEAELMQRLEAEWHAFESVERPSRFSLWWGPFWRGPIRHRRAYRFLAMTAHDFPDGLVIALAALFSGKRWERSLRKDSTIDTHLTLNEIRDLTDELQRRVHRRNAKP